MSGYFNILTNNTVITDFGFADVVVRPLFILNGAFITVSSEPLEPVATFKFLHYVGFSVRYQYVFMSGERRIGNNRNQRRIHHLWTKKTLLDVPPSKFIRENGLYYFLTFELDSLGSNVSNILRFRL